MAEYIGIAESAAAFAIKAHDGQIRKLRNTPYFLHCFEVASIAATMTDDREVIAAALLHDVVEESGVELAELRDKFGERVAALVESETEKKGSGSKSASWEARKQESIVRLQSAEDIGVKILWLSDKLSNVRSFCQYYVEKEESPFLYLNQKDPARHAWYYRSVAHAVEELKNTGAYAEYAARFKLLFEEDI